MGLEGIVSKRLTAAYRSGPLDWIRVNPGLEPSGKLQLPLGSPIKYTKNMKRVKSIQQQRRRGRPDRPGGSDPVVPVRLPKAVIADIDRWAKREKIDKRSKAVRALIEKGLTDALDE
jgi:hypothetical protein